MMPAASLSVPHCKQERPYSCVPACVRMVLAYYGHERTEEELRQLLDTGPHGTRARAIFQVATLGFHVQLGRSNLAELTSALREETPPIVFIETAFLEYWKQRCDHVAVVVGLGEAIVSLNDPYFDSAPQNTPLAGFRRAWAWLVQWS